MSEKPYTRADVELINRAWKEATCHHYRESVCVSCSSVAILDALSAAGRLAKPAPERHVIAFADDGTWHMEHPPACRAENDAADAAEWDCPVRKLAEQVRSYLPKGRYECWASDLGGVFVLGDRVDQADDCPCLPGAPAHIHGVGGYAPTED